MHEDYTFREAGQADFPAISEFLKRHDFGPKEPEWMQWKYLSSPYGWSRIFVMEETKKDIKGLLAYEPRLLTDGSIKAFTIMQAVDGILAPEVRGKGFYSKLLKYSMNEIGIPIIGFPTKRAEIIELRCGFQILSSEYRWVFPAAIGGSLTNAPLHLVAPFANLLSRIYASIWLGRRSSSLEMRGVEKFERDFPIESDRWRGLRTAEFLNWRFVDNPMKRYHVYEFFHCGESIGYSVYALDGSCAEVFDFVASRNTRNCLRLFVDHCRGEKITHLLFRGVGIEFGRYGFIRRTSSTNYIGHQLPRGPYMITLGDSDW